MIALSEHERTGEVPGLFYRFVVLMRNDYDHIQTGTTIKELY